MLGRIEKLWKNDANGKPYLVLEIDKERYSLWDEDCLDRIREGDIVEYQWKKAGKFRNITSIERVNTGTSSNASNEKDHQILRMSCLKSASTIFSGLDAKPKEKVRLTIAAARCFEKYINDTGPCEPSDNSQTQGRQYQGLEDDLDTNHPGPGNHRQPRL
jgi:hypothetical protein